MKKIVAIGPESTGKSTLCQQLADHYDTLWVPEYARAYMAEHGAAYTYDDLLAIAKGQVALEEEYIAKAHQQQHPLLFIDTDQYVMKVWADYVYTHCHPWILEQISQRKYDLYLLCNVDLPWEADVLREYPDLQVRQRIYDIYKNELLQQSVPWVEITGNYDERLQKAVSTVDNLLQK
jgi:NadR type nicotinamide-nucleotide adenylyltransferase